MSHITVLQSLSLAHVTSHTTCILPNCLQVHRFLVQVATDNIALTGLNFFPVTRTVLLTVSIVEATQVFLQGPVYNLGENAAVVHILSIGTTSNITSSKHVYNSSTFCPNLLETLGLLVPTRNERHFTLFSIEQSLNHNRLHSMGTKTFTTISVVLPSVLENHS